MTAVAAGSATIYAAAGDKKASCSVTVNKKTVDVTGISLDRTSVTLTEGQETTLVATVMPSNATDKTVSWSSSNSGVATVNQSGVVNAVAEGSAVITASAGNYSATCTVTVQRNVIAVTSITLNKNSLTLTEGESETLTATVMPENATDKTVTWSSSNADVATVDQSGKVTAVAAGSATIYAAAGDKKASCTVTVNKKTVDVTSITLDKTCASMSPGQTITLTATVKPDNATDKTVTWTSTNPGAATVDQNGKVTAVAEGTAIIKAEAGGLTATCEITVEPPGTEGGDAGAEGFDNQEVEW